MLSSRRYGDGRQRGRGRARQRRHQEELEDEIEEERRRREQSAMFRRHGLTEAALLQYHENRREQLADARVRRNMRRIMHTRIPTHTFTATIELPSDSLSQRCMPLSPPSSAIMPLSQHSHGLGQGNQQRMRAESQSIQSSYLEDEDASTLRSERVPIPVSPNGDSAGHAEDVFKYSPTSFPPTPQSRQMVLNETRGCVENVIYGARDQLWLEEMDRKYESGVTSVDTYSSVVRGGAPSTGGGLVGEGHDGESSDLGLGMGLGLGLGLDPDQDNAAAVPHRGQGANGLADAVAAALGEPSGAGHAGSERERRRHHRDRDLGGNCDGDGDGDGDGDNRRHADSISAFGDIGISGGGDSRASGSVYGGSGSVERSVSLADLLSYVHRTRSVAALDRRHSSKTLEFSCGGHCVCRPATHKTRGGALPTCSNARAMLPVARGCAIYIEFGIAAGANMSTRPSLFMPRNNPPAFSVGLVPPDMPDNVLVGQWPKSIGLCSESGTQLMINSSWFSTAEPTTMLPGTTIGILVQFPPAESAGAAAARAATAAANAEAQERAQAQASAAVAAAAAGEAAEAAALARNPPALTQEPESEPEPEQRPVSCEPRMMLKVMQQQQQQGQQQPQQQAAITGIAQPPGLQRVATESGPPNADPSIRVSVSESRLYRAAEGSAADASVAGSHRRSMSSARIAAMRNVEVEEQPKPTIVFSINGRPCRFPESAEKSIQEHIAQVANVPTLFPAVSLLTDNLRVWCRFSEPDIVCRSRHSIGAPRGIPVLCLDGTVLLPAEEDEHQEHIENQHGDEDKDTAGVSRKQDRVSRRHSHKASATAAGTAAGAGADAGAGAAAAAAAAAVAAATGDHDRPTDPNPEDHDEVLVDSVSTR